MTLTRSTDIRRESAEDLRDFIISYTEEHLQDDKVQALWSDLPQRIFELIHSNQSWERKGGIVAVGEWDRASKWWREGGREGSGSITIEDHEMQRFRKTSGLITESGRSTARQYLILSNSATDHNSFDLYR